MRIKMSYPPSKFNLGDTVKTKKPTGFIWAKGVCQGKIIGKGYRAHRWYYIVDVVVAVSGAFGWMLSTCDTGSFSYTDPLDPAKPSFFSQSNEKELELVNASEANQDIREIMSDSKPEEDHGGFHLI